MKHAPNELTTEPVVFDSRARDPGARLKSKLDGVTPGEAMLGLISPGPKADGPRLENVAMWFCMSKAPEL